MEDHEDETGNQASTDSTDDNAGNQASTDNSQRQEVKRTAPARVDRTERPQFDLRDLQETLASLPESIANAVGEKVQPPAAPRQPRKVVEKEVVKEEVKTAVPGQRRFKSFGHRWFGIESAD